MITTTAGTPVQLRSTVNVNTGMVSIVADLGLNGFSLHDVHYTELVADSMNDQEVLATMKMIVQLQKINRMAFCFRMAHRWLTKIEEAFEAGDSDLMHCYQERMDNWKNRLRAVVNKPNQVDEGETK